MPSPSHTRPESARPPSRLMSANAARRAIAQLDHITPSAHYTAVGDSPFATSLDHRQVKRWHSVPGVENSPLYFCQSSRAQLCSRELHSFHSLTHRGDSCLCLPLLRQHPALPHSSPSQPIGKALFMRELHEHLCVRVDDRRLPEEHVDPGASEVQGKCQAKGMRELLGPGERLGYPLMSLIWIPQTPQRPSRIRETSHL